MVRDCWVSRAEPMLFYFFKLLNPYYSLFIFPLSLLSIYRLVLWAGLTGCSSLSLSLALPKRKERKKKMFIQIKNIWYYNVYIHKLKLSIKYFNINITITSYAEKVSFHRVNFCYKIESTLVVRCTYSRCCLDVITKNTWICDQEFLGKHLHHW